MAGARGGNTLVDLDVAPFIAGLTKPWDIAWLPNGTVLVTERSGPLNVYVGGVVAAPFIITPTDLVANGEGGMMGLEVDPDLTNNGFVYVCMASDAGTATDVRLVRYELQTPDGDEVINRADIATGMPYSTGRESGCRPRFGPDGYLWVGTGDAAIGTTPQNDDSLGGKVLRMDRNGIAAPDNPSGKRWFSKGHRNIQGMAFPHAIEAIWSGGSPTLALSGASFIEGSQWGDWDGVLAVATLKAAHLHIYSVSAQGEVTNDFRVIEDQGRLRSPRQAPDGLLYITNDGGASGGQVLRVSPVLSQ